MKNIQFSSSEHCLQKALTSILSIKLAKNVVVCYINLFPKNKSSAESFIDCFLKTIHKKKK